MICPHCGAIAEKTVTRDGVIVHSDPLRVNYRGSRLNLTKTQAGIMAKLVRNGRASYEVLGGYSDPDLVRVHIAHLRRRLPPAIRIVSVYGWGYELQVERPNN